MSPIFPIAGVRGCWIVGDILFRWL